MSITTAPYLDGVWQPYDDLPGVAVVPVADPVKDIQWSIDEFRARLPRYGVYHAYLTGKHNLVFATKSYRRAFQLLLQGLNCNLSPRVVHALTDRLRLTGFEQHSTEAGTGADGEAARATQTDAQKAWALWQDARLDRHFNQVKIEAVATGDAYMLVWPDPEEPTRPRFYPQRATDMIVRYDRERTDTIVLAAKLWREGKRHRLNLYYIDRIEKYQTTKDGDDLPEKANGFERYQEPGEPWPVLYRDVPIPDGRVPVFHLAFGGGIGQCGRALLHDVIPLQDALNKTLADLMVASEFGAFRQKWAIGVDPDAEEGEASLQVGMDRLISVMSKDARFGEFAATDLKAYTETIEFFFRTVAQIKGIPLHHLMMSGNPPSGESLKTMEAPLVARVLDTQTDFGDVLEDMLTFALTITGELTGDHTGHITAVWQSPESRAEKDHIDAIATKVKDIGLPLSQAWEELSYSAEEIADFQAQKAAAAPPVAPVAVVVAPAGNGAAVAAPGGE